MPSAPLCRCQMSSAGEQCWNALTKTSVWTPLCSSYIARQCMYIAPLNQQVWELLPQSLDLVHCLRHELLATEPWLHCHDQYLCHNQSRRCMPKCTICTRQDGLQPPVMLCAFQLSGMQHIFSKDIGKCIAGLIAQQACCNCTANHHFCCTMGNTACH